jgi:HAD superfamily hydrolase (TIGR01458 family)
MTPKCALLDVDGTLIAGDDALPGAVRAVRELVDSGVAVRFATNTTRRPRSAVAAVLRRAGFDVEVQQVIAPSILARRRILDSGATRSHLLVAASTLEDFAGLERDEDRPDWVVVGDLGSELTFEHWNGAFLSLMAGARLLALHRNRFWHTGSGLAIDAGAFVAGLEYATGAEAEVVGKPSPDFFRLALASAGVEPRDVVVVGDDIENDCRGGVAAGCRSVLVRTGKFREEDLARVKFRPDLVLGSIAELPSRLGDLG